MRLPAAPSRRSGIRRGICRITLRIQFQSPLFDPHPVVLLRMSQAGCITAERHSIIVQEQGLWPGPRDGGGCAGSPGDYADATALTRPVARVAGSGVDLEDVVAAAGAVISGSLAGRAVSQKRCGRPQGRT
jgi:hypothetical protein